MRLRFAYMKRNLFTTLFLLLCAIAVHSQSYSPKAIAAKVSSAYPTGVAKLDRERLIRGRLTVMVENSLSERVKTYRFSSFSEMERWLKRTQRPDGTPIRESRDLLRCTNARCTFNFDGGILHNHLYLQQITFGSRNGRRYVKVIRLLDGA